MHQVPCVGRQIDQPVAGGQGPLGVGRHLHEVDVHVQQAQMAVGALGVKRVEGSLEHINCFERARALRRLAADQVPQFPGGPVHDRLGEQGADIQVIAVGPVDLAHRVCVGVVPSCEVVFAGSFGVRRVAVRQRTDQRAFEITGAC